MPNATAYHGIAELRTYLGNIFSAFPDFKMELKSTVTSGQRAVTEWVMTGAFKGVMQPFGIQPTGKSFSVRGATVAELEGDKIKHESTYYDGATFMQQLGIAPSAA